MDYQESVQYLKLCAALGSKPGLFCVTELLKRLGNPQESLRFIHIAGTNGKGSVGYYLECALKEEGYRVGFFTSPYLQYHREMIQIDCEDISENDFASVISDVAKEADAMEEEGLSHPTEFEIMTAAAYLFYKRVGCDFVIAEAGMGGAKDATNVMKCSEVSVLTRIDYDHVQFLGGTLSDITREKCGIFRERCPVVVYPDQETEVLNVIGAEATAKNAPLFLPLAGSVLVADSDDNGSVFSYGKFTDIRISACGKHQVFNAVTALSAVMVLRQNGVQISDDSIYKGFLRATRPGRFEILSYSPLVVLDGAHNANGAVAFARAVETCFPNQEFIGVVGMLGDKNLKTSIREFSRVCRHLIVTSVPNPRSASCEDLLSVCKALGIEAIGVEEPAEAVRQAFLMRRREQGIFCVGSLYALSTFRESCNTYIEKE